jgi:hypothetical protein
MKASDNLFALFCEPIVRIASRFASFDQHLDATAFKGRLHRIRYSHEPGSASTEYANLSVCIEQILHIA